MLESARQDDPFASELADLWSKIEAQAIIADSASGDWLMVWAMDVVSIRYHSKH